MDRRTFLAGALGAFAVSSRAAFAAPISLVYRWTPGSELRYRLTATIEGSLPLVEGAEPIPLTAVVKIVYRALPKTVLADGSADVDLRVATAELEVEKVPVPFDMEDARKILDLTVTFDKRGKVLRMKSGAEMPFSVRIPGVDPKRLYALIYPVVFPQGPVDAGETWEYQSEFLGGQGAEPTFTATLLAPEGGQSARTQSIAQLRQNFKMAVRQDMNEEKEPVLAGGEVYQTMRGHVEGRGLYQFDRARGCFTSGEVNLEANIDEEIVGKPKDPCAPKKLSSRVKAKVTVTLETTPAKRKPARAGERSRP